MRFNLGKQKCIFLYIHVYKMMMKNTDNQGNAFCFQRFQTLILLSDKYMECITVLSCNHKIKKWFIFYCQLPIHHEILCIQGFEMNSEICNNNKSNMLEMVFSLFIVRRRYQKVTYTYIVHDKKAMWVLLLAM